MILLIASAGLVRKTAGLIKLLRTGAGNPRLEQKCGRPFVIIEK